MHLIRVYKNECGLPDWCISAAESISPFKLSFFLGWLSVSVEDTVVT